LVIRGGLFSGSLESDALNPIGFAAVGALVGMFSQQAILKLKSVAETLLSRPEEGADPAPPRSGGTSKTGNP
jgi:hypothetical protein